MTIATFSAGPWRVNPDLSHPWVVQCPTNIRGLLGDVCTVSYRPDAFLIAAAPELFVEIRRDLAFVREMKSAFREVRWTNTVQYQQASMREAVILEVLAKAEGPAP